MPPASRHWALTISRPYANVRRVIPRLAHLASLGGSTYDQSTPCPKTRPAHHLAGAHKHGVAYLRRRAPRCGLGREEARLGAPGAGGEMDSLFEHPAIFLFMLHREALLLRASGYCFSTAC